MSCYRRHTFNRRQALAGRIFIWLMAEIWLNFVGMDNLADYSEFLFERHAVAYHHIISTIDI